MWSDEKLAFFWLYSNFYKQAELEKKEKLRSIMLEIRNCEFCKEIKLNVKWSKVRRKEIGGDI